jgi:hypothetical protein
MALRLVHHHGELGGEHDLLAAVAEQLAERGLRPAAVAVDVGGVEQRDAAVECLVDHRARRREVDAAAEIVAAEPDHRHAQARLAEIADFHVVLRHAQ